MTLQNRVTPTGELVADPNRGTLMGNRGGRFHDPATRTVGRRRWAGKAWITCVLERRGIRRSVWGEGYTELFFLDEVVALAAGHRPCALCRRDASRAFLATLRTRGGEVTTLPALDAVLHAERLDGRAQRRRDGRGELLPDGAVILVEAGPRAIKAGRLLEWTAAGWREAGPMPAGSVEILTPATALLALDGGYEPVWHQTAA